jgi:hypothetical protein
MDIDKYINENLDTILENTDEFISSQQTGKKKKQVSWKDEIEIQSKIIDRENEDIGTNEDLQDELFESYYEKSLNKKYFGESKNSVKFSSQYLGIEIDDSFQDKTKNLTEYLNNSKEFVDLQAHPETNTEAHGEEHMEENKINEEEIISEHKLNLLNLFLVHYKEKYNKCENYFSNISNVEKDTNNPMELFFESIVEFKKVRDTLKMDDEQCLNYYCLDSDDKSIDKMYDTFNTGQMYCLTYKNTNIVSPSILVCLNYLIDNKENLFEGKEWVIFNLRDN